MVEKENKKYYDWKMNIKGEKKQRIKNNDKK